MTTVIIDCGCGNLRSLAAACKHVGMDATIANRDQWVNADAMILPGVGSFRTAMLALHYFSLDIDVARHVKAGKPLLGICLGMQVLFDRSEEGKEAEGPSCVGYGGLGLIPGTVRRLPDINEPIPNVGWRAVRPGASWSGTLLAGIEPNSRFYFSHSYACYPTDGNEWLALSDYGPHYNPNDVGETSICAAVQRGNVTGLQFHPEKSGEAGLAVLRAWRGIVEAGRIAA